MSTGIVWFRRDLRLDDNPAWAAATHAHDRVVPLVVLEPTLLDNAGPFRRAAFVHALHDLDQALAQRGGRLHVAHGDPTAVLLQLLSTPGAARIYANADVSRWAQRRDRAVDVATDQAVEWSWGTLVHRPGDVLTKAGTLSRVFTPFWKRWDAVPLPPEAVDGTATPTDEQGIGLPPVPDHRPIRPTADWEQLVEDYESSRDTPSISGTSRLSTALRFGTISARRLAEEFGTHTSGRQGFVRQLAWRDWYAHTTLQFPDIDRRAIRPEYDTIRWEQGPDADRDFAAWQHGRTGYPIVDAGMRELAATGWMHNRVRMIAASFLVKDLLIDWRRGERHFRHLLSDAEPSQNAGNWQWVAGTGPDAAPYFRIFNPVTQSRRFDPDGHYIRQWVPELDALDKATIHAPWEAAPLDLAAAGVVLDDTYPAPIIDHAVARDRTLAAYSTALDR
ncbi:MAG: cryptochrome/photolyase family protein [Acidimicrobiales bacterium]